MFIDFFVLCGQVYGLKSVSSEMVKRKVLKSGDGSHSLSKMRKQEVGADELEDICEEVKSWETLGYWTLRMKNINWIFGIIFLLEMNRY